MSLKSLVQLTVVATILVGSLASPGAALAGGGCGTSYVVQWGDSLSGIAAYCGTTVAALYAANPGISGYLYAGQVLALPGTGTCSNCSQGGYSETYTVQSGDTFAKIAQRYGVSVNSLWAANPYIWNINYIYPGQVLYIPGSWFRIVPTAEEPLVQRSYGAVPPGTSKGNVKLINSANAEVYVSLQGTTADGAEVINEYPVDGTMRVQVPSGWYIYVAWVGGKKYSGQFKLGDSQTIIFYTNKVVLR